MRDPFPYRLDGSDPPPDPLDAEVDANTRAMMGAYYRTLRQSGLGEDDALREVAERQKRERERWNHAKREDANG